METSHTATIRPEKICPRCAESIKAAAEVCRFCGHDYSSKKQSFWTELGKPKPIGCLPIIFFFIMASILFAAITDDPKKDAEDEQQVKIVQTIYSHDGQIKALLKDPDSAQITHLGAYCGLVNAKNSFGGYTGNSRWLATDKGAVIENRANHHEFVKIWKGICSK